MIWRERKKRRKEQKSKQQVHREQRQDPREAEERTRKGETEENKSEWDRRTEQKNTISRKSAEHQRGKTGIEKTKDVNKNMKNSGRTWSIATTEECLSPESPWHTQVRRASNRAMATKMNRVQLRKFPSKFPHNFSLQWQRAIPMHLEDRQRVKEHKQRGMPPEREHCMPVNLCLLCLRDGFTWRNRSFWERTNLPCTDIQKRRFEVRLVLDRPLWKKQLRLNATEDDDEQME